MLNKPKTELIFVRGGPAVGKTTITNRILKLLKTEHKLDCAYISEDDFRKQMQFKYKSMDLAAHTNSVELIKAVILKLLEIDSYDKIFIEGQFRYREIIEKYEEFAKKNNLGMRMFQLELDINEMVERDVKLRNTKSRDILEVKRDIDSYVPDYATRINTKKPIDETIKEILSYILR